jgi:hypothetical protein
MRRVTWMCLMGFVLAAVPMAATAQNLVPVRRNVVGINGAFMQPTGEFEQFVPWGGGLGLNFVAGLHREGVLGLRIEGNALFYGHERYDVWVSPRLPYLTVNTTNFIANLGVGPQITLGQGAIRPYGFGLAGVSYFATETTLDGEWGETIDRETNFDDARFALSAGGGMLVQIAGRRTPLFLDLGAVWTHNGRTTYLREGGIVDNPDGSITVYPIRSEANHWTFRLGLAVGI